jgi:aryl-alcohol dehydrogenase
MIIDAAVVYEKSGPFNLERLELDRPDDDEVLVRMVATGVCHTDLAARDQHLPIPLPGVFGHEGAGVVEQIGARVTKVRPGDHVVLSWKYCGACPSCLSGAQSYCRDFFPHNFSGARPDGRITMRKGDQPIHGSFFGQSSFATFSLTHEKNVVPVRRDTPLEVLGPLGCGVLTGTGAVIHSLRPKAGSSIAVFGAGTVGLSAVMAAAICGCTTIIAVGLNAERLKLAMELGATHAVSARQDDPVAAIRDLTGGGVQFSLECVGAPAVLRQAVEALAMPGVCGPDRRRAFRRGCESGNADHSERPHGQGHPGRRLPPGTLHPHPGPICTSGAGCHSTG